MELCKPWWRYSAGGKHFSRESLCGPICWSSRCFGSVSWWYNHVQVLVSWKLQEAVSHRLSSRLGIKHLSPDDLGFYFMEKMQRMRNIPQLSASSPACHAFPLAPTQGWSMLCLSSVLPQSGFQTFPLSCANDIFLSTGHGSCQQQIYYLCFHHQRILKNKL